MMPIIETRNLNVWYGDNHVLKDVNVAIEEKKIVAIIGPSGCGKTTFLRTLNRMIDLIESAVVKGEVLYKGINIYREDIDIIELRRKIGMVFQKPTPLPMSIYDNVAYGLRLKGIRNKKKLDNIVRESLIRVGLWDEVKHRLDESAFRLSIGQQQRLAIARVIAINPDVLLMDEPTSALDPISTARIEELIKDLSKHYTIVMVTHNMAQARRIADYTMFFYYGELVEYGPTKTIFENPKKDLTRRYVTGQFG